MKAKFILLMDKLKIPILCFLFIFYVIDVYWLDNGRVFDCLVLWVFYITWIELYDLRDSKSSSTED